MEKTFTSSVNVMGILFPRDKKSHDIPRDKNDSPKEIIARRIPGLFLHSQIDWNVGARSDFAPAVRNIKI